jgi:UDP-N-acetylmuramoyl-L-alanyl-D-glutamate--2,6-diaminopimelate ligase
MRLGELVAGIAAPPDGASGSGGGAAATAGGSIDVEVTDLAYDSRGVRPGTMFCCVPGLRRDGHEFAAQAVADGAVALLVQRRLGLGVPEVVVGSVRAAMGPLAARLNGEPTRSLKVIGVTGTNGKTTSAYMVRALLQAAGVQTGLLGTVTSVIGGREREVWRTTPEAIDLQAEFRAMLEGGDEACAMEVSSHALALGRTNGIEWAGAVFTNLTRDHLDFHETMEDYYEAKRRLFLPDPAGRNAWPGDRPPGVSVVNVGDEYGRRLTGEIEGAITWGVQAGARCETEYGAEDVRCDAEGCTFRLRTPKGDREVALPMPGRFNVENAVGALAVVHAMAEAGRHAPAVPVMSGVPVSSGAPVAAGIPVSAGDLDTLVAAIERGVRVPGRFEAVTGTAPKPPARAPTVIVDYAHTPDSLENVLRAAREIAQGRVVCVFGAGGDRDRGKRPKMGEAAARLADVAIVTSDNPRSEDPEAIVAEIVAGIPTSLEGAEVHVEEDRRMAIERAVALAQPEDVVVIAGKGHEQGQELAGGRKVPFDDRVVAEEVLSAQVHAGPGMGDHQGCDHRGPGLRERVARAEG